MRCSRKPLVDDMGEGLHFATLAALVGKKFAARWGKRRVTIGAVGKKDGARFVMGTFSDGSVVLGEPQDFTVYERKKRNETTGG